MFFPKFIALLHLYVCRSNNIVSRTVSFTALKVGAVSAQQYYWGHRCKYFCNVTVSIPVRGGGLSLWRLFAIPVFRDQIASVPDLRGISAFVVSPASYTSSAYVFLRPLPGLWARLCAPPLRTPILSMSTDFARPRGIYPRWVGICPYFQLRSAGK
jgi:hypothetical protein